MNVKTDKIQEERNNICTFIMVKINHNNRENLVFIVHVLHRKFNKYKIHTTVAESVPGSYKFYRKYLIIDNFIFIFISKIQTSTNVYGFSA